MLYWDFTFQMNCNNQQQSQSTNLATMVAQKSNNYAFPSKNYISFAQWKQLQTYLALFSPISFLRLASISNPSPSNLWSSSNWPSLRKRLSSNLSLTSRFWRSCSDNAAHSASPTIKHDKDIKNQRLSPAPISQLKRTLLIYVVLYHISV